MRAWICVTSNKVDWTALYENIFFSDANCVSLESNLGEEGGECSFEISRRHCGCRLVSAGWSFQMGSAYQFHSWRVFVLVCAFPCVAAIAALNAMPESPRFYLEVRSCTPLADFNHMTPVFFLSNVKCLFG